MKPRAVIFDLFGTLATFSPSGYARVEAEMAGILTVSALEFSDLWTKVMLEPDGAFGTVQENLRYVLRTLGAYVHLDQERKAIDVFYQFERALLEPSVEVRMLLQDLRHTGMRIAVLSNTVPVVARLWPTSAFNDLVDEGVFSCEIGVRKPDARAYVLAAERLQVASSQCVFVGDGDDNELTGAEAAGMRAVWFRGPQPNVLTSTWHGEVIESLGEVLTLVRTGEAT